MSLRRAGVIGAVALVATVLPVAPAPAQTPSATQLRLVSEKLVLAPEEPLVATLGIEGPVPEGATLTVTVSSRLREPRADLHALLDDGAPAGRHRRLRLPGARRRTAATRVGV